MNYVYKQNKKLQNNNAYNEIQEIIGNLDPRASLRAWVMELKSDRAKR